MTLEDSTDKLQKTANAVMKRRAEPKSVFDDITKNPTYDPLFYPPKKILEDDDIQPMITRSGTIDHEKFLEKIRTFKSAMKKSDENLYEDYDYKDAIKSMYEVTYKTSPIVHTPTKPKPTIPLEEVKQFFESLIPGVFPHIGSFNVSIKCGVDDQSLRIEKLGFESIDIDADAAYAFSDIGLLTIVVISKIRTNWE